MLKRDKGGPFYNNTIIFNITTVIWKWIAFFIWCAFKTKDIQCGMTIMLWCNHKHDLNLVEISFLCEHLKHCTKITFFMQTCVINKMSFSLVCLLIHESLISYDLMVLLFSILRVTKVYDIITFENIYILILTN